MLGLSSNIAEWQARVLPFVIFSLVPVKTVFELSLLLQFGLQDPTLIRTQGFIGGKWVDAKHGDKIVVTSELVPFPLHWNSSERISQTPRPQKNLGQSQRWVCQRQKRLSVLLQMHSRHGAEHQLKYAHLPVCVSS